MINLLVTFLATCAGVRQDAQALSPRSRTIAATLGCLMLLMAFISTFTSGYALYMAFLGETYALNVAIGGGLIWGVCVFCIDRLMVAGFDKFSGGWATKAANIAVRVLLAMIVALVMSTPFVLRLSLNVIESELLKEQRERVSQEIDANAREAGLADRRKVVSDLKGERQDLGTRINGEPDSPRYKAAADVLTKAEAWYRGVQASNVPKINRANESIRRIKALIEPSQADLARASALWSQAAQWRREIEQQSSLVKAARREQDEARLEWRQEQQQQLDQLNRDFDKARKAEADAKTVVEARNLQSKAEIDRLTRPNLVNQYRMLRRITEDPKHPDALATIVFERALHLFFLFLELTPIMWKIMAKRTPLDDATQAVEALDKEQIISETNVKILRRQHTTAARIMLQDEALRRWQELVMLAINSKEMTSKDLTDLYDELDLHDKH